MCVFAVPAVLLFSTAFGQNFSPQLKQAVISSPIVFEGTIKGKANATLSSHLHLGSLALPVGPAVRNALEVHIDHMLDSSKQLQGFEGNDITLLLPPDHHDLIGDREIFLTRAVAYGKTLEVEGVAQVSPASPEGSALARPGFVRDFRSKLILENHLTGARYVVVGQVDQVVPLQSAFLSEHEADWMLAIVEVTRALKGLPGKFVSVIYPASTHEGWKFVPKFPKGTRAIWLLMDNNAVKQTLANPPPQNVFSAFSVLDFEPVATEAYIEDLLKVIP